MNIKDKYAIVGIGYTPQGRIENRTALSFHAEACANAIMDAGLERKDIDGLMCYRQFPQAAGEEEVTPYLVAQQLGLAPRMLSQEANCARSHFHQAIGALEAGLCNYVVLSYADTQPFWDACRRHELRFQKCLECDHVRWPASIICPSCYSKETEFIRAIGKGVVYTYTVYHQAFHPAFEEDLPYVTAIIELDEGPHFLSNIVGCDPEAVYCDMPVELVWEDVDQGFSLPKFKPVI